MLPWSPGGKPEREKMLAGELYYPFDAELSAARDRARRLCRLFNHSEENRADRERILKELFGELGEASLIEPPFRCDYGSFIRLGRNVFMNFDCVILDCAAVTIGDNVLFGPGVHIYGATHPTDSGIRSTLLESAKPVTVGSNVWIGGRSILCPGVTIGDHVTIGAGSVVTRDIPAGTVAVGNPCRVIRKLSAEEMVIREPIQLP
jgi:maltose O-acetyltransferase